jgi:tRNA (mo5U34)-methyltransferase
VISLLQEYLSQRPRAYKALDWPQIRQARVLAGELLSPVKILTLAEDLEALGSLRSEHRDYSGPVVELGRSEELSPAQQDLLLSFLQKLIPWRKGPFSYFGQRIDAEWRSDLKWSRIDDHLGYLGQEVWGDVGCNNEYYMYRLLQHKPDLVVGFDPLGKYFLHHLLNQRIYPLDKLIFELLGVEDLGLFPEFFHGLLFMGVLYHRRDPLESLNSLARSLRPGGRLILETIIIPGEEEYALIPQDRYLKAKGYWFLPMRRALLTMIQRSGFEKLEVLDITKTTGDEQRKTDWIKTETLEDFLDPQDNGLTAEGYPAPHRIVISARRKARV